MGKNGRKIVLFSFLGIIIFSSCAIAPTYSRREIAQTIKEICEEENNIIIQSQLIEDTLWLYYPYEGKIFNEEMNFEEIAVGRLRNIFVNLNRVVLSSDSPPRFYVVVFSDIKEIGSDVYFLGFIRDILETETNLISGVQRQQREVLLSLLNPNALGDKDGAHIKKYNVSDGEFLALLIRQAIERKFFAPEIKEDFKVNVIHTDFLEGRITISLDIEKYGVEESSIAPFYEAKEITAEFLKIYPLFTEIKEVQIIDMVNKKIRVWPREELL